MPRLTRLPHNHQGRELPEPLVDMRRVGFTYPPPRSVVALRGVSLTVARGEFVALIGRNGSGKTTLTKCLSGHLRPMAGEARIADRVVTSIRVRERPKWVGYTFQNPDQQLFKVSVWDDVKFGLENLRYPRDVVEGATEEILRYLELWAKKDLHPFRLSKGDRERLAIATVAVMQPLVLIVDEPTTGQDPVRAREIMDLLRELNQELELTVLVVTHAMDLVTEYCRRVVALSEGDVLIDGEMRQVFGQTELLAQTAVRPPPVVRLALALDLSPLPVTVEEAEREILARYRGAREAAG